jgi:hypothetical protein
MTVRATSAFVIVESTICSFRWAGALLGLSAALGPMLTGRGRVP